VTSDTTAIVIASISAVVSLTVAAGGEWARRGLASRQAEQAKELQEAKGRADAANARAGEAAALAAQEARLRTELRTEFMAEEGIRLLLEHEDWTLRSFEEIKRRIRGFDDAELRKLLVRAGAVAFDRSGDGAEMWGLRARNRGRL
jgi:hypothetical protein